VKFREGDVRDLQDLMRIEQTCFGKQGFSRRLVEVLLLEEDMSTIVVENVGEIVAYSMLFEEEKSWSTRIISIAVMPEHRGEGIAKALLQRMELLSRNKQAKKMTLEVGVVNVPAINLYLNFGFKIEGNVPDYYGRGKDAFYLEKRLVPS
jgi:ribosomal protein S18 acetylase RimI-like enzyme